MDFTTPDYGTAAVETGAMEGLFALMGSFFLVFFIVLVFLLVCSWKIYAKAGKPGWAAIVPIYNIYVLMDIIKKPWWWMFGAFLSLVPLVGQLLVLVWSVIVTLELGRKFGKSNAFSIIALYLFSFVGYPMLAFGSATYNPSAPPVTTFLSENGGAGTPPAPTPEAPTQVPPAPPTDEPQV